MALVPALARTDFNRLLYTFMDDGADAATATIDPNTQAVAGSWLDTLFETDTAAGDAAALAVMQQAEISIIPRVMASNGTLALAASNNAGRTRITATAGAVRGANTWDVIIKPRGG